MDDGTTLGVRLGTNETTGVRISATVGYAATVGTTNDVGEEATKDVGEGGVRAVLVALGETTVVGGVVALGSGLGVVVAVTSGFGDIVLVGVEVTPMVADALGVTLAV